MTKAPVQVAINVPEGTALTAAERDVLLAIVLGQTTPEIALERGTSLRTVETQRHQVQRKLAARNTAEMVRIALMGR